MQLCDNRDVAEKRLRSTGRIIKRDVVLAEKDSAHLRFPSINAIKRKLYYFASKCYNRRHNTNVASLTNIISKGVKM